MRFNISFEIFLGRTRKKGIITSKSEVSSWMLLIDLWKMYKLMRVVCTHLFTIFAKYYLSRHFFSYNQGEKSGLLCFFLQGLFTYLSKRILYCSFGGAVHGRPVVVLSATLVPCNHNSNAFIFSSLFVCGCFHLGWWWAKWAKKNVFWEGDGGLCQ